MEQLVWCKKNEINFSVADVSILNTRQACLMTYDAKLDVFSYGDREFSTVYKLQIYLHFTYHI